MRKAISATLASLLLVTSAAATAASAKPRHHDRDRDRFVSNYCAEHPRDRDCRDWNRDRNHWDESRYNRWYREHRRDIGPGDAAAALFGFAVGAIGAAAATAGNAGHGAACDARYRSYDWRTDMYRGFDGEWHYCRL